MPGKRARSPSFANSPTTAQEATSPTKRPARSIEVAALTTKSRSSSIEHYSRCVYYVDPSSGPRKRRACSTDPPTPPHLRSSGPYEPKRLRARSLDRSPPPLPLTRENLCSLEHSTQSFTMSVSQSVPRNPSPTRKDTAITDRKQLAGYNITVDQGIALPAILADFVETLEQRREQEPSPHAQAIIDTRRAASLGNEITAKRMMEEHILFRGEGFPDGIKGLILKDQVNLVKDYLPEPPDVTVPEQWGSLARPQPDSCIGYITATEAKMHTPPFAMPFTRKEDGMADWLNVVHNADVHFPFLTAQWKAAVFGENQIHASLQAARDGALIVNYMHHFYSIAYPNRPPSQLETCHFSLTTESYTIILWIHWREVDPEDGEVYFRMEEVEMARMGKLDDLLSMRRILHNYLEFALGERLRSIKEALPSFWPNRPEKKVKRTKTQSSAQVSVAELRLDIPMTPSSSMRQSGSGDAVSPKKIKRKRTGMSS